LTFHTDSGDLNCDYSSGECFSGWDLTHYQPTYGCIFAFSILACLIAIVLGIILQVACWAGETKLWLGWTLVLTCVVLCCALLAVLFVVWGLLWNHPSMALHSRNLDDGEACTFNDDDEENGGFLCSWNGARSFNGYSIHHEEFLDLDVRAYQDNWGPSVGWILTSLSGGFAFWTLLLILGWRPIVKQ